LLLLMSCSIHVGTPTRLEAIVCATEVTYSLVAALARVEHLRPPRPATKYRVMWVVRLHAISGAWVASHWESTSWGVRVVHIPTTSMLLLMMLLLLLMEVVHHLILVVSGVVPRAWLPHHHWVPMRVLRHATVLSNSLMERRHAKAEWRASSHLLLHNCLIE